MSGLLALLDDVAAIAKLAVSQLDDIAAQAAKAGSKAVGVVIDAAAVTPKYVTGLPAAREIPIVAKIARGSLFNGSDPVRACASLRCPVGGTSRPPKPSA